MCGIGGILSKKKELNEKLLAINTIQQHRGPDHQAVFETCLSDWHIGLAHQRLAILDLSEAGNQPMMMDGESKVIIYNGEIYNYNDLFNELKENPYLKGHSDTEVVLHAIAEW